MFLVPAHIQEGVQRCTDEIIKTGLLNESTEDVLMMTELVVYSIIQIVAKAGHKDFVFDAIVKNVRNNLARQPLIAADVDTVQ